MEINESVEEISRASKGWFPVSDAPPVLELNGRAWSPAVDAACMSEKIMVTFGVKLNAGKER